MMPEVLLWAFGTEWRKDTWARIGFAVQLIFSKRTQAK
jgi:hypothetical protein